MTWAQIIQIVSVAGVVAMIAAAWWAKIPRPTPELDPARARDLLAVEFPDNPINDLWIASDGAGAVARSGTEALVVYRAGDGYVARSLSWADALIAPVQSGHVRFRFGDFAAPRASLAVSGINPWPPQGHQAGLAA
ncbi:MAG: hypothetical protein JWP35_3293 [Caulobacter sp.]|nr:hypothetical protein [Caulobacter sp.]